MIDILAVCLVAYDKGNGPNGLPLTNQLLDYLINMNVK